MKTREEIENIIPNNGYGLSYNYDDGFIDGYIQCQKDMADEKLDEDVIKEIALDYIINTGGLPKTIEDWQNALWKFYQSLNKQD